MEDEAGNEAEEVEGIAGGQAEVHGTGQQADLGGCTVENCCKRQQPSLCRED